ncbi:MAG: ATP-dependent DNA helicase RecG [Pseudohongiellaceae bacterium]
MPEPVAAPEALTSLNGVGPALAQKLGQMGIHQVRDLLFHLPHRYEDRTRLAAIGSVSLGDLVQLQGEIVGTSVQFGRRRSLLCLLRDRTGVISLRFFHFSAAQREALEKAQLLRCYGEVRRGRSGFELYHPEYRILEDGGEELPAGTSLTPVYPTTDGLQQPRLRRVIDQALTRIDQADFLEELLPESLRQALSLPPLVEAIRLAHQPPADAPLGWLSAGSNPGQRRLAFEELLAHRLAMRQFRRRSQARNAPKLHADPDLRRRFLDALGFTLTGAQQRVSREIRKDLESGHPMLRLVQGDVGSGKTVVAALAALQAIGSGHQVALMAPTEILAEQHLLNFQRWFGGLGIQVGWLSGKTKGAARKTILEALSDGQCQLVIGTHALFQDEVNYHRLGLVIIDEQHRFGVHQRLALRDKARRGESPHQLVMTATPIPRTLAMSAYADLDSSVIDELPPGRTPVNTALISATRREEIIGRIEQACREGNQAYWVCTLIEESEALQAQAAEATATALAGQMPGLSIGLIHGRLKPAQKAEVMARFKAGEIQLLVATTVIEVGVDVPNASLMIIENPERLGLAQLHQLRGRVGRGARQSHCLLLYQTPLSQLGRQRLKVMRESTDGFYIAEKDLELRGPGQVLGTQQTGMMTFRIADISRDAGLLDDVKRAADLILSSHPELVDPLIRRWLGDRVNYVNV